MGLSKLNCLELITLGKSCVDSVIFCTPNKRKVATVNGKWLIVSLDGMAVFPRDPRLLPSPDLEWVSG